LPGDSILIHDVIARPQRWHRSSARRAGSGQWGLAATVNRPSRRRRRDDSADALPPSSPPVFSWICNPWIGPSIQRHRDLRSYVVAGRSGDSRS